MSHYGVDVHHRTFFFHGISRTHKKTVVSFSRVSKVELIDRVLVDSDLSHIGSNDALVTGWDIVENKGLDHVDDKRCYLEIIPGLCNGIHGSFRALDLEEYRRESLDFPIFEILVHDVHDFV
jgi:hypothetical protein